MKRFQWKAERKGQLELGSVVAENERRAMEGALRSREWKGDGWRITVGSISTTFDLEDIGMLCSTIGDEHATDEIGKLILVPSDLKPKVNPRVRPKFMDPWMNRGPDQCKHKLCNAYPYEAHHVRCPVLQCDKCGAGPDEHHDYHCPKNAKSYPNIQNLPRRGGTVTIGGEELPATNVTIELEPAPLHAKLKEFRKVLLDTLIQGTLDSIPIQLNNTVVECCNTTMYISMGGAMECMHCRKRYYAP
jgi:hypothetical protein